jgi:hypothetical protein
MSKDSKLVVVSLDTAQQTELPNTELSSIAEGSSLTSNTMRLVNSTTHLDISFKGKAVHTRVIETIWQRLYGDRMAPFNVECYILPTEHFLEATKIFGLDENTESFTFCKSNHSSEYVILVRESNFDNELHALKSEIETVTQANWLTKSVGRLRLYE